MLDRYTGKILHIDFGDCFEVAMHREKYPEKIPFRLTRMLTNAMEVGVVAGGGVAGGGRMKQNRSEQCEGERREVVVRERGAGGARRRFRGAEK